MVQSISERRSVISDYYFVSSTSGIVPLQRAFRINKWMILFIKHFRLMFKNLCMSNFEPGNAVKSNDIVNAASNGTVGGVLLALALDRHLEVHIIATTDCKWLPRKEKLLLLLLMVIIASCNSFIFYLLGVKEIQESSISNTRAFLGTIFAHIWAFFLPITVSVILMVKVSPSQLKRLQIWNPHRKSIYKLLWLLCVVWIILYTPHCLFSLILAFQKSVFRDMTRGYTLHAIYWVSFSVKELYLLIFPVCSLKFLCDDCFECRFDRLKALFCEWGELEEHEIPMQYIVS